MDYLGGWQRAFPIDTIGTATQVRTRDPDPKAAVKAFWAGGNWAEMAKGLDSAAEELVKMVAIEPGHRVLDVAAGNGNAAIWAAKRGARVVATDLCPQMVVNGIRRSVDAKLQIDWRESDFENLPFADGEFDHVVSAFGVMFAENPRLVTSEMFRVAKPGGTVGVVNWTPYGWPALIGEIMSKYVGGARGEIHTPHWGIEKDVRLLFAPFALDFKFQVGAVLARFESAESWWRDWERNAPMIVSARKRISPTHYQCLSKELIDSVIAASAGNGPSLRWESEYLIATAKKGLEHAPAEL